MEHGRENASPEGLRYRKKLKARLAVERAALELVIERGYDGVTVEDICARAEISKKTFFNYFPSKASVIMGRMHAVPDDERLLERLAEQDEACYLDVLVGVVSTTVSAGVDDEIESLRREALRSMPQLFFHGQRDLLAVQRSIAAALRSYLCERPERRMLAGGSVEEEAERKGRHGAHGAEPTEYLDREPALKGRTCVGMFVRGFCIAEPIKVAPQVTTPVLYLKGQVFFYAAQRGGSRAHL